MEQATFISLADLRSDRKKHLDYYRKFRNYLTNGFTISTHEEPQIALTNDPEAVVFGRWQVIGYKADLFCDSSCQESLEDGLAEMERQILSVAGTPPIVKRFVVEYSGGEGGDYLLCDAETPRGEDIRLYAEIDPSTLTDSKGRPIMLQNESGDWEWNQDVDDPETFSFDPLAEEIQRQARVEGIDLSYLDFV